MKDLKKHVYKQNQTQFRFSESFQKETNLKNKTKRIVT